MTQTWPRPGQDLTLFVDGPLVSLSYIDGDIIDQTRPEIAIITGQKGASLSLIDIKQENGF